jgi:3-polyprenyl-4-hydroxybenzoate decarboxylase
MWLHVLERVDWRKDLFVFANVSQDTLDYTGPSVNKGSKAMLMGLGREPLRKLPEQFTGTLPAGCSHPTSYLPGTLVVQGQSYEAEPQLPEKLAGAQGLADWPLIILVDNTAAATENLQEFMWTVFTRFEPAADIHAAGTEVRRFHVELEQPVVFDCRMKPWYTPVLEVDRETKEKVDSRIADILPPKYR